MRAHTAMTCGVILARLLNEPKVTKPFVMAGRGETGGASAYQIVIQKVGQGLQDERNQHLNFQERRSHSCRAEVLPMIKDKKENLFREIETIAASKPSRACNESHLILCV